MIDLSNLQVGDAVHFENGPKCHGDDYRRVVAVDLPLVCVAVLGVPRWIDSSQIRGISRPTPDPAGKPSSIIDIGRIRSRL